MKVLVTALLAGFVSLHGAQADLITVDFDTADNWTAGSASITSYASDHSYAESGFLFTGGPALRNTTSDQDGFAGALGTYSWRLQNLSGVSWTATYTLALDPLEYISQFGMAVRRWDGSPSPAFVASYSVNGGSSWVTASSIGTSGTIDNAGLGNTSDWSSFSQSLIGPTGLAANQFVVRLESSTSTERIMVDNFSMTTSVIPEPSTFALLSVALLGFLARRRAK